MTRNTQQLVLAIAASIFSMGVVGWLMYKLGIVDVLITLIVQFACMFLVMGVIMGIIDPLVYDQFINNMNDTWTKVKDLFTKRKFREVVNSDDVTKS